MRSFLLIPIFILTACSGGSGSGTSTNPPSPHVRAVPGGTVEVKSGEGSTFTIAVALTDVPLVEALSGPDYNSANALALTAIGAGAWSGSLPPGSTLLVRVSLHDGTVVETAPGDFPLR